MTAIGTSERHYLPEWALGAVDVCEIDAVMAADDEWRFGRSVPVRAGTPSSPLVGTSDGTVAVNVYGNCERPPWMGRDGARNGTMREPETIEWETIAEVTRPMGRWTPA